jgi:hypothetical protein
MPSQQGRIYDCICSDSCLIQEPLAVAGGSIYDNAAQGTDWRFLDELKKELKG